jgi:hypothetical protein
MSGLATNLPELEKGSHDRLDKYIRLFSTAEQERQRHLCGKPTIQTNELRLFVGERLGDDARSEDSYGKRRSEAPVFGDRSLLGVSDLLSFASRILDQEKRQVENTNLTCRSCIMYMLRFSIRGLPNIPISVPAKAWTLSGRFESRRSVRSLTHLLRERLVAVLRRR